MARIPTKRGKPAPKLRGNRRPIALTLPPELVDEIDAVAAQESRTRVMMIEVACREYLRNHQRRTTA
jgi:metal-responsive CopG/Arc/MetJ family transcriptional regulator